MPVLIEAKHPYRENESVELEQVIPGEKISFPYYELNDTPRRFVVSCLESDLESELYIASRADVEEFTEGLVRAEKGTLLKIKTLKPGQRYETRIKRSKDTRIMDIIFLHI